MRIAHVMAGSPAGGAELFFERLTAAQQGGGDAVLAVIRANPRRAARLREAGLDPVQLRFGGRLDLFTTPRLRRALQRFPPQGAIAWMDPAAPLGPPRHLGV